MIRKQIILTWFSFIIPLLLVNCAAEIDHMILTPEETAIRFVREMKTSTFTIYSNSVQAIQTATLNDLVLVLIQYDGERIEGGVEMCEIVLELHKALIIGWEPKNSAGLCHDINDSLNSTPITVVSSWSNSTLPDPGYSIIFGYVRDPQITKVVVTWDDEQIESIEVEESTYFAVRGGCGYSIKKIEAYNNQNDILFENRSAEENRD